VQVLEALHNPAERGYIANRVLESLLAVTGAAVGAFHERHDESFVLLAEIGTRSPSDGSHAGIVARASQLRGTAVLEPLPPGYLRLESAVGSADVPCLTLTPLRSGSLTLGAVELGWLRRPEERVVELLDAVAESIAVALSAAAARARTDTLLAQTQHQADQLKQQQAELRTTNEELEAQAKTLRRSQEALTQQREELQTTNEELEEKGELLERQRRELQLTADELRQATRYKSEFLANMSHELRTPLNSLLILSKELAANEDRNLTADQVEAAQVIYDGGRDLLALINDILDLSKVESGKMEVHGEDLEIRSLLDELRRQFGMVAEKRGLTLELRDDAMLAAPIVTDRQRLVQILRNLLSNAIKFTEKGRVTLTVERLPQGLEIRGVKRQDLEIAFAVADTGIGIPRDRLETVFEAFRQGDGSTSRRFGGTGLGLTIARQMAALLGGEIFADSEPGRGSRFTLALPQKLPAPAVAVPAPTPPTPTRGDTFVTAAPSMVVADDRQALQAGERTILVIEDDPAFATVLRDVIRRHGYRCLVSTNGHGGIELALRFKPDAVLLDLGLPDADGMAILEQLKGASGTRHIPVHIVSAKDPSTLPLQHGAFGFLSKPADAEQLREVLQRIEDLITRPQRTVVVVEDDRGSQIAIRSLLQNERTRVVTCGTGAAALQLLRSQSADCVVLDLSLPDTEGIAFLEQLRTDVAVASQPPVVVYTGRELAPDENRRLTELAQSIVIKGAASPERLLDEVVLFLHEQDQDLSEEQRRMVARLHGGADAFVGRKLLLVDDDMRNTFALSSLLRKHGFQVQIADNGMLALMRLDEHPDTDAVLMDVMMPQMDGLEATRRIRAQPRFRSLPIIALTARAMVEDRRKCLEAGVSDYLSKPIEIGELLAMLRIWLGRTR
jgi:CheY-like chemotaxis protein